jgi:hypothetical protein
MAERGTSRRWAALVAGVALLGVIAGAVAQAAVSGSGPINRFDGRDEIVEACTNRKNYGTVPKMVRTFTVTGSTDRAVVVMFEGSLSLGEEEAFDTGFLRLTIDDVEQSPGEVPAIAPGGRGTHGFNWQTEPLSPGSHTARVQWRTDLGNTFCADARSIIVLHT